MVIDVFFASNACFSSSFYSTVGQQVHEEHDGTNS